MKGWRSALHTVALGGPFAFGEAPFKVEYRGQRERRELTGFLEFYPRFVKLTNELKR